MDWPSVVSLWPPDQQVMAVAVALAESGGRLDAACENCAGVPERSYGPWQVNVNAHPQFDPYQLTHDWAYSAQAAFSVWQASGWEAWSTYTNGAFAAHLADAQALLGSAVSVAAPAAQQTAPAARQWWPVVLGGVALAWAVGWL